MTIQTYEAPRLIPPHHREVLAGLAANKFIEDFVHVSPNVAPGIHDLTKGVFAYLYGVAARRDQANVEGVRPLPEGRTILSTIPTSELDIAAQSVLSLLCNVQAPKQETYGELSIITFPLSTPMPEGSEPLNIEIMRLHDVTAQKANYVMHDL